MSWAVNELAATICEHLEWYTAGGGLKVDGCLKLLNKLEAEGVVELTERQRARRRKIFTRNEEIVISGRTDPSSRVEGTVGDLEEVRLEVVVDREEKKSVAERADWGACCLAERRSRWGLGMNG